MKKLIVLALLLAFAAPLVMAQKQINNPKMVALESTLERLEELPQVSQKQVVGFLEN